EREGPVAEEAERQHRGRSTLLPGDEARHEQRAGDYRQHDAEARPAVRVAAYQAPHDAEQADAREPQTPQGEAPVRPPRPPQLRVCERCENEADGHVEPEDPMPGDAVDDRAADERPDSDRETADASPDPECEPATLTRHGGGEDRQRERRDDRRTDAL